MDDGIEAFVGECFVTKIAAVESDPVRQSLVWWPVVEGRYLVTCLVEVPDDVSADETRGTGDEDGERSHAPRPESTTLHEWHQTRDVFRGQFIRPESNHPPTG